MSTNLTCFAFVNTEIFSFKVRTFFFWKKSNLANSWICKELKTILYVSEIEIVMMSSIVNLYKKTAYFTLTQQKSSDKL